MLSPRYFLEREGVSYRYRGLYDVLREELISRGKYLSILYISPHVLVEKKLGIKDGITVKKDFIEFFFDENSPAFYQESILSKHSENVGEIFVDVNRVAGGELDLEETLIHEMAHALYHLVADPGREADEGHSMLLQLAYLEQVGKLSKITSYRVPADRVLSHLYTIGKILARYGRSYLRHLPSGIKNGISHADRIYFVREYFIGFFGWIRGFETGYSYREMLEDPEKVDKVIRDSRS